MPRIKNICSFGPIYFFDPEILFQIPLNPAGWPLKLKTAHIHKAQLTPNYAICIYFRPTL
jgi:hypothetical protein